MVAKKKTSSKTTKKKSLKASSPEQCFYLVDGSSCADLLQLADALERAADEVFNHHVQDDNNDFANWIEHVFDEKTLAKDLRKAKNKDAHVIRILRYVISQS